MPAARAIQTTIDSVGHFISGANSFLDVRFKFVVVGVDGSFRKFETNAVINPADAFPAWAATMRSAIEAVAVPLGFTFAANDIVLFSLAKA